MPVVTQRVTFVLDMDASGIEVSEIVADESVGYSRRLLIYTEPVNSTNRRADIEIVLTSATMEALEIPTPALKF